MIRDCLETSVGIAQKQLLVEYQREGFRATTNVCCL
jgi:hypothetical protein